MKRENTEKANMKPFLPSHYALCLDVGLEVVLDAAVDLLEVAAAASAGASALDGLDGPVEASAASAGIGACCAALPLDVVRIATAAAAQNVGAAVARTHRCGTLRHLALRFTEKKIDVDVRKCTNKIIAQKKRLSSYSTPAALTPNACPHLRVLDIFNITSYPF